MALATLAAQVEAGYARFDAVAWVLVAVTMVSYVSVWNEYVQGIATYVWFPNLADAIVPFGIATLELFLAHFAVLGAAGLRGYLLVIAMTFFAAAVAYMQLALRATSLRAAADNRDMHHTLDRPRAVRIGQSVAGGIIALAACAAYAAAGFERYALDVALALAVVNVAYLLASVPYWNRVLAYAQVT